MTAACNFISLGKKMRELLDITIRLDITKERKKRRKEKRKITDHMIGQKRREICALCRSVCR